MVSAIRNFDDESLGDAQPQEPIQTDAPPFGVSIRGQFNGTQPRSIVDAVMVSQCGIGTPEPDLGDPTYYSHGPAYWFFQNLPAGRQLTESHAQFKMNQSAADYSRNTTSPDIIWDDLSFSVGLGITRLTTSTPRSFFLYSPAHPTGIDTGVPVPDSDEFLVHAYYNTGGLGVMRLVVEAASVDIIAETFTDGPDDFPTTQEWFTPFRYTRNFPLGGGGPSTGYLYESINQMEVVLTPYIVTSSLPSGFVGDLYSADLEVDGDPGGVWDVYLDGLPPGVSFDPDTGGIEGTPTEGGTYPVTFSYLEPVTDLLTTHEFSIEIGSPDPEPMTDAPGWSATLNGVTVCGGDCAGNSTVVACMTSLEGTGVPPLRTEDQTYPQRDGVDHFADWYEPRILTMTAVVGGDESGGSCGSARVNAKALSDAWKRQCEDVELVLTPDCAEGIGPELLPYTTGVTGWDAVNATLSGPSMLATVVADGAFIVTTSLPLVIDPAISGVVPVEAGHLYTFTGSVESVAAPRGFQPYIVWFDALGTLLSPDSTGTITDSTTGSPTDFVVTAHAPVGAAYAQVAVTGGLGALGPSLLGEEHEFGAFSLHSLPDPEINGPFGVTGRPRVAVPVWMKGPHQVADFTLRFDATGPLLYILDPGGEPGSGGQCVTVSPVPQFPDGYGVAGQGEHSWPLDFPHLTATPSGSDIIDTAEDVVGSVDALVWAGYQGVDGRAQQVGPIDYRLSLGAIQGPATFQVSGVYGSGYTSGMFGFWLETPTDSGVPQGFALNFAGNLIGRTAFGAPDPSITWEGNNDAMNSDVLDYFGFTDTLRGQPILIMLAWINNTLWVFGAKAGDTTPFLLQTVTGVGMPLYSSALTLSIFGKVSNAFSSDNLIGNTAAGNAAVASMLAMLDDPSPAAATVADVGTECVPFNATFNLLDPADAGPDIYIFNEDGDYVGFKGATTADQAPYSLDTATGTGTLFYGTADGTARIIGNPFMTVRPGENLYVFGWVNLGSVTICHRPAVISA